MPTPLELAWTALLDGQPKRAGELVTEALRASPSAETYLSVGLMHSARSDHASARAALAKAVEVDPDNAEALHHLSVALLRTGEAATAARASSRANALKPGVRRIVGQLFAALQLAGDFAGAMTAAEGLVPFLLDESPLEPLLSRRPLWDGAPGQRVLITHVSGFGDNLQFARYVAAARSRCIAAPVFMPAPLASLFERSVGDVVTATTVNPESFDAWCPITGLPLRVGVQDVTAAGSYLKPSAEKIASWARRVTGRFKVGLVGHGSGRGGDRNLTPDAIAMLSAMKAACFNLAPGAAVPARVTDLGPMIRDFDDTAAIIANLDLVISIDTATAHLAGALGKPTWVLLPHHPGWSWGLRSDAAPWYPSVHLYRQTEPGGWGSVVARLLADLDHLTATAKAAVS